MHEDIIIECHPPAPPLWHWPAIFFLSLVFPGAFILAALVIVSELLTHFETSTDTKTVFAVISALLSLFLMFLFLRWQQDRWHWALTRSRLIGGRKRNRILPLSDVVKVVPGLPSQSHIVLDAAGLTRPDLVAALAAEKQLALALQFADGSWLPFHVHRCVNGTRLMTELTKCLADRLDHGYKYSTAEVKTLRLPEWNRVVRTKKRASQE